MVVGIIDGAELAWGYAVDGLLGAYNSFSIAKKFNGGGEIVGSVADLNADFVRNAYATKRS